VADGDAILNRWLFAGGDRQVRDVMVNGQWVVRQGRHGQEEKARWRLARYCQLLG
jgi:formimidoylglutamate deiminase